MQLANGAVCGSPGPASLFACRKDTVLPMLLMPSRIPLLRSLGRSLHLGENGDVELRIVLLHVASPVLAAEFLDHGRHLCRVGYRNGLELSFCASRIDA